MLSAKTDKYECLTGEEIFPFDLSRIIEQTKFFYYFLGKAFDKQIKQLKIKEGNKQMILRIKYKSKVA